MLSPPLSPAPATSPEPSPASGCWGSRPAPQWPLGPAAPRLSRERHCRAPGDARPWAPEGRLVPTRSPDPVLVTQARPSRRAVREQDSCPTWPAGGAVESSRLDFPPTNTGLVVGTASWCQEALLSGLSCAHLQAAGHADMATSPGLPGQPQQTCVHQLQFPCTPAPGGGTPVAPLPGTTLGSTEPAGTHCRARLHPALCSAIRVGQPGARPGGPATMPRSCARRRRSGCTVGPHCFGHAA